MYGLLTVWRKPFYFAPLAPGDRFINLTLSAESGNTTAMKCYTHKDTEAVAVCVHCGRALCAVCAAPSQSGRLVCSPACAAASKEMEESIASTRHKANRSARVNAYFCFGLGAIFVVSAVAMYFDIQSWPLSIFIGASGLGLCLAGMGFNRVAKRNTERGAT
jgi:hypothetical protein